MSETLTRLKVQTIIESLEKFNECASSDGKTYSLRLAKKLVEQLREVEEIIDPMFNDLLDEALDVAITKAIYHD